MTAFRAKRVEAVVSAVLAVTGLALAGLESAMPKGGVALPGPGFVPLAIGVLLAVVGGACAFRAFVNSEPGPAVALGGVRVWGALATLAAVGFAFEDVGAPLTLAAAVTLLARLLGEYSWRKSALVGVLASAAAWLVFTRLLGVGLPAGPLPL